MQLSTLLVLIAAAATTQSANGFTVNAPVVTSNRGVAAAPTAAPTTSPSFFALFSTLAPTETTRRTDENDDDGNDEIALLKKRKMLLQSILSKEVSASLSIPFKSAAARTAESKKEEAVVAAAPEKKQYGAISMTLNELAEEMGGMGRAQLAWDCYSIGIDPSLFFGSVIRLGYDDFETIHNLLPSCRQRITLGAEALNKLSQTYQTLSVTEPVDRLEGGVASLTHISQSHDRTTKLLLKLADGLEVETVIIPWTGGRSTLCISSQVGCRQGCTFCATGRMGKLRSLTSDEILAQMFYARKICRLYDLPSVTNVVFMGMGEPADNAENVLRATQILTTRQLFQLSATRVTVSTVAPTPEAFMTFAKGNCVLAWSVHAVDDDLRRRLVPTTKYSMVELRQGFIDALLQRPLNFRSAMIEVALMNGVNDQLEHAEQLADFCRVISESVPGCKLMINLIPFNDIGLSSLFQKPTKETVVAFQKHLWAKGVYAHVRQTRGDDATAACGQLATLKQKSKKQP